MYKRQGDGGEIAAYAKEQLDADDAKDGAAAAAGGGGGEEGGKKKCKYSCGLCFG